MSISAEILGQKIKIKSCKIGDSGQNVKIKICFGVYFKIKICTIIWGRNPPKCVLCGLCPRWGNTLHSPLNETQALGLAAAEIDTLNDEIFTGFGKIELTIIIMVYSHSKGTEGL